MSRIKSATIFWYVTTGWLALSFSANDPALKATLFSGSMMSIAVGSGGQAPERQCLANHSQPLQTVSAFNPWRFRIKTVLEKTSHPVADEVELARTVPPQSAKPVSRLALDDIRIAPSRPLRC